MKCYMGITFCAMWIQCEDGDVCELALTPQVQDGARADNKPLQIFSNTPPCYKAKVVIEDELNEKGLSE